MRLVLALLLALIGSGFAGFLVATVLAEWAGADQGYIIVFFTVPRQWSSWCCRLRRNCCGRAQEPADDQRREPSRSAAIVAFAFVVLSAMTLGSGLERWMIWRDMQLVITIGASALAVVVAHHGWIFRWLSASTAAADGRRLAPGNPRRPDAAIERRSMGDAFDGDQGRARRTHEDRLCYGDSLTWGYDRHRRAARPAASRTAGGCVPTKALLKWARACYVVAEDLNGRTTAFDDHLRRGLRNGALILPTRKVLTTHADRRRHPVPRGPTT